MKNSFNTDDININNLRNEFKRYIKCGLTVDEAIKKFNIKHCYDGVEVYRSLCETIELKYVRYIGLITTDQEIESIRKDTKLKELYKKREECKAHIDDLVTEFNNISENKMMIDTKEMSDTIYRSFRCPICNKTIKVCIDDMPGSYLDKIGEKKPYYPYKFCPNCGTKAYKINMQ